MTDIKHSFLILLTTDFVHGIQEQQRILSEIQNFSKVLNTSSVYKRYLDFSADNLNSELVLVLRGETDFSEKHLQDAISKVSTDLLLLALDQEVNMLPGNTLPHPLLHTDPLTLRCAAEAWGSYEHPVLGQTLNEIVRSDRMEKVEFFAQGRAVLE